MSDKKHHNLESGPSFGKDEIALLMAEFLPDWKTACDEAGLSFVVLRPSAFGNEYAHLVLLGAAIKYAGLLEKDVIVVGTENTTFREPAAPIS